MKTGLALALLLALAPVTFAEQESVPAPPAKKACPLCKVPGRAALFAGVGVQGCPADCPKLCCTGTEVTYLVQGLVCDRCINKVTQALTALEGVQVETVCHLAGQAVLKYDPSKVTAAKLVNTIVKCGYQVNGEKASFKVTGLTDDASAKAVENALTTTKGVRNIKTVCHQSGTAIGTAIVVFDPTQTTRDKVAAAINTTKFKVATGG